MKEAEPGREWWPELLLDEVMPPGRSDPSAWIIGAEGDLYLISDGDAYDPEEKEGVLAHARIGDRLDFYSCDRLGDVEVTFNADGTFTPHGSIPDHNWCRIAYDQDTMVDGLEELAKNAGDFAQRPFTETVQFARWSGRLPHELALVDGKPTFVPAGSTH